MRKSLVLLLAFPVLLEGCGQAHKSTAALSDRPVQWSSLSTNVQHAIIDVSKHYGDASPVVSKIIETQTNPDQRLMYIVHLQGHFHKGNVDSNDLSFSILGDGTKAWAISNQSGSLQDDDLLLH